MASIIEYVYDPRDNSFYFELQQGVVARSVEYVNGRVCFDLNEANELLGIEFVLTGMKFPVFEADALMTTS